MRAAERIPKDRRRVPEVDFPIAEISRHAERDLPAGGHLHVREEHGPYGGAE